MTSKKPSYQKVPDPSSDATDDENFDTEEDNLISNDNKTSINMGKDNDIKSKKKKDKTFWEWVLHKPFSKGPLLYFLVGILGSIGNGIFFIMDNDTGFIICGVLGLSLCIYGFKHFYTLIGLKMQIDKMTSLNQKFHREHRYLSKEVDRITAANDNLRITHQRLQKANEQNRENLDNFRQIQDNMQAFGKTSIEELEGLQLKSKHIENKWHDQLYEHQRNLLHTVFERMERQGSRRGMNMEEFKQFELQLPDDYRNRFDRMGTFHKLSKNDSLIDYDDFRASLDLFAEMATDDVDIEFEIEKKSKPKKQKSKRPKNIKFRNMSALQEDDNEIDIDDHMDEDDYKLTKSKSNEAKLSEKGRGRFGSLLGSDLPNKPELTGLTQDISVDLEDIEFDEEEDDAPVLYERKIVVTKRTERSRRFQDIGINLWDEKELMKGSNQSTPSEEDYDGAVEAMFGKREQPDTPKTPGFTLEKRDFKLARPDDTGSGGGSSGTVKLKEMGRKQFANLLDEDD